METGTFAKAIYEWVAKIPRGRVTTYGQLAMLAGKAGAARSVGRLLAQGGPDLPYHRVVASDGSLPAQSWGWDQRKLLQEEGVQFTESGKVIMKEYSWRDYG